MRYETLIRKRTKIIAEVAKLRARHGTRKPLLNLLIQLTTRQLKQENRAAKRSGVA